MSFWLDRPADGNDGSTGDIPIGNFEQPLFRAVRQDRPAFDFWAHIEYVRVESQNLENDRELQLVLHHEVAAARGKIEIVVFFELGQHWMLRERLRGEVQTDLRGDGFQLAARLETASRRRRMVPVICRNFWRSALDLG